ncbi:hypothetical protein BpHYR1_026213 [Brachionus plicatilis]|uniref:Uncharacterized protein n=1 Tax=Brachionus plicatilis TaxID=10195 RepID=A0A3M7QUI0_BRAPC|nr:hypothetical protein BpHYR1_026213 [Brachionus plicatilis]
MPNFISIIVIYPQSYNFFILFSLVLIKHVDFLFILRTSSYLKSHIGLQENAKRKEQRQEGSEAILFK